MDELAQGTSSTKLYAQHQHSRDSNSGGMFSAPGALLLASPRGSAQHCKYKSGKCANPRATKRNGQLHTLCHFHRLRQNEHQRKSDRKHRMVSVARRAKLGTMGLLPHASIAGGSSTRRPGRASSAASSDYSSDAGASSSTPASPMSGDFLSYHQHAYVSPFLLQPTLVGTPTGRLPPISFLTQPGKLDSFRASSASSPGGSSLSLPPPSSFMSGGGGSGSAPLGSKTA